MLVVPLVFPDFLAKKIEIKKDEEDEKKNGEENPARQRRGSDLPHYRVVWCSPRPDQHPGITGISIPSRGDRDRVSG